MARSLCLLFAIHDDYDLDVIRVFYSNLSVDDITVVQGNVIGISFTSTVRGQKIYFDDDSLNAAIGIKDAKYRIWEKSEKYPEESYLKILGLEGKERKALLG